MTLLNQTRAFFVALTLALLSSTSFAANVAVDTDKNSVAIKGHDPVAYFTESAAVKGDSKYTSAYNGAIYHFASAKNRDLFNSNPEKYAPQYGGFCAFGVTKHRKFSTDPEAWKIVDGKLYLNLNKRIQKKWLSDVPGYLEQSESIWPEIKGSSDDYLASADR